MLYMHYPTPVTVPEEDKGGLVIHRKIKGKHQDSRSCWCSPHVFEYEELDTLTADKLNALMAGEVH